MTEPHIAKLEFPVDTVNVVADNIDLIMHPTDNGGVVPALIIAAPGFGCYRIILNAWLFEKLSVQLDALDAMTPAQIRDTVALIQQLDEGGRDD